MVSTRLSKRGPQFGDVLGQQRQPPFRQIDGEEDGAPGDEVATIIGHAGRLAWRGLMGIAALHPFYGLLRATDWVIVSPQFRPTTLVQESTN